MGVEDLQFGPPPLRFYNVTVPRIVERLKLLFSGVYQDACEDMAEKVRSEGNGGDIVADVVEREMVGKVCEG